MHIPLVEGYCYDLILQDKVHTLPWSREAVNLQMTHPGNQIEVAGFSFHFYSA
jgi:hypothetical protein